MKKTLKRVLLALAAVGVGLIVWGLLTPHLAPKLTMPDLPATATPSPVVPTVITPTVTAAPVTPSVLPGSPVPTRVAASPTAPPPAETAHAAMADPRGNPTQITIKSVATGKLLVSTAMAGVMVNAGDRWSPKGGRAEWLTSFPKPGTLSRFHGIIAGHVSGGGEPDVFYGLTAVRVGDTIKIAYDSGQVLIFTVSKVEDAGKSDVVSDPQYDWIWNVAASEPADRVISIFTCDPDAPHVNGHSLNNIVAQAVRTS